MEALSRNYPPNLQRPSAKAIPSLWVQLPDIHQIEVLSVRDKLPDEFILPPVTIDPNPTQFAYY
jgi:hypothetical protein